MAVSSISRSSANGIEIQLLKSNAQGYHSFRTLVLFIWHESVHRVFCMVDRRDFKSLQHYMYSYAMYASHFHNISHNRVLVITCISRCPLQDLHEVSCNNSVGLFRRMQLIKPQERVRRLRSDTIRSCHVTVVLKAGDICRCCSVEILCRVVVDIQELDKSNCGTY